MSKKEKEVNIQNNSKDINKQSIKSDCSIVINIYEKGQIIRKSNANTKEQIYKMLCSPVVDLEKKLVLTTSKNNKTSWFKPAKFPPEYFYQGSKRYNEPDYQKVVHKVTWSPETVKFFISDEGRPSNIKNSQWKNMSKIQKIKANIEILAEGKEYDFTIID